MENILKHTMKTIGTNKKGAALIYVIVAVSLILTLGASTTLVAYSNLQTTTVRNQSNTNFYNTDSVLKGIVSGLEKDMSIAYAEAYEEVIAISGEENKDTNSIFVGEKTQAELDAMSAEEKEELYSKNITEYFDNKFFSHLKKIITGSMDSSSEYSLAVMQQYVQDYDSENVRFAISAYNGKNNIDEVMKEYEETVGSTTTTYYKKVMYLRNLHVSYENDNGYFDEITTDIKIESPEFEMPTIESTPFTNYTAALIADEGLELAYGKKAQISGDVYLNEIDYDGEDTSTYTSITKVSPIEYNASTNIAAVSGNAILINTEASLNVAPENIMVAGGDITVGKNLTFNNTNTGKLADLWTENIELLAGADVSINANTYVFDDTEINGISAALTLQGTYVGYNQHDKIDALSSSINVNGEKATINFSGLTKLILAGTAFTKTSEAYTTTDKTDTFITTDQKLFDIETGESFSVKSNQITYLLEDIEGLQAINSGKITDTTMNGILSNPMTYEQYKECMKDPAGIKTPEEMWSAFVSYLNNLSPYGLGKTYGSYGAEFKRVFNAIDSNVYIYVSFPDAYKAAEFFRDAMASSTLLAQRVRTYAEQYLSSFTVSKNTEFYSPYNYVYTGKDEPDKEKIYTNLNIQTIYGTVRNGLGYMQHPCEAAEKKVYEDLIKTVREKYTDTANIQTIKVDGISMDVCKRNVVDGITTNDCVKYDITFDKIINETKLIEFIDTAIKNTSGAIAKSDEHTNTNLEKVEINATTNGVILTGTNGSKAILVNNRGGDPYTVSESGSGVIIATGDIIITGNWTGSIIIGGRCYLADTSSGTGSSAIKTGNDLSSIAWDNKTVASVMNLYYNISDGDILQSSKAVINVFRNFETVKQKVADNEVSVSSKEISACISFANWDKE